MNKSRMAFSGLVAGALVLASFPSQAAGPYQFHSITPCRLADTRDPVGPSGGPKLVNGATRNFPVQGLCGVPDGAKAVTVNVTAVGPTNSGFLTLFPSDLGAPPLVSSVNFALGESAVGNGAIVPVAADRINFPLDLSVFAFVNGSGQVHFVLDVTGYFQ